MKEAGTNTLGVQAGVLDRFHTPLYTISEAACYLDVPVSTLTSWTHGYTRRSPKRREVVGDPVLTAARKAGPAGR